MGKLDYGLFIDTISQAQNFAELFVLQMLCGCENLPFTEAFFTLDCCYDSEPMQTLAFSVVILMLFPSDLHVGD